MANVAVLGGAGYVGRFLIKELLKHGHSVTAYTRENGKILLDGLPITISTIGTTGNKNDIDVLINLAYPVHFAPHTIFQKNDEIINILAKLANDRTKIIHASTLAVFGFGLDRPIKAERLPMRRDFPYIESKLYMENSILNKFKKNNLHIVRIGNVWGPDGAVWTHGIIEKIFWNDPITVKGTDGYSNTTDVMNVASYINHLVSFQSDKKTSFHHLAEFSHIKWSHWINKISDSLNTTPAYTETSPSISSGFMTEMKNYLKPSSPSKKIKEMLNGRYTGSYLRLLLSSLPYPVANRLYSRNSTHIVLKPDFAPISPVLTCTKQFTNITDQAWLPETDENTSWERVLDWMKASGYINILNEKTYA